MLRSPMSLMFGRGSMRYSAPHEFGRSYSNKRPVKLKYEEQIQQIRQQAKEGKLPTPIEVDGQLFQEEKEELEEGMKMIRRTLLILIPYH